MYILRAVPLRVCLVHERAESACFLPTGSKRGLTDHAGCDTMGITRKGLSDDEFCNGVDQYLGIQPNKIAQTNVKHTITSFRVISSKTRSRTEGAVKGWLRAKNSNNAKKPRVFTLRLFFFSKSCTVMHGFALHKHPKTCYFGKCKPNKRPRGA